MAASSGSSVKICDLRGAHEPQTLAGQLGARDVVFSPDGKVLITWCGCPWRVGRGLGEAD